MDVKSVKKKTQSVVYMSKLILECLFSADVGIGIWFHIVVLLGILCLENKKVQEF